MPRLPFNISHKSVAKAVEKRKAALSQTQVVTDRKVEPYDSSKVYMQLGTSLKASEAAQVSAMRVARMMAESNEAVELQEAALAERLRNLILELDDFEKTLLKFKRGRSLRLASLATAALDGMRAAMGWYGKFLANHSSEDMEQLKPVLAKLQAVAEELAVIKGNKVDATVAMEDAFNEKRASAYRKATATQNPGQRIIEPSENSIEDLVDPQALLDAAKLEIIQKEQDSKLENEK